MSFKRSALSVERLIAAVAPSMNWLRTDDEEVLVETAMWRAPCVKGISPPILPMMHAAVGRPGELQPPTSPWRDASPARPTVKHRPVRWRIPTDGNDQAGDDWRDPAASENFDGGHDQIPPRRSSLAATVLSGSASGRRPGATTSSAPIRSAIA